MRILGKDGLIYKILALVIYFIAPLVALLIALGVGLIEGVKRCLKKK